MSACLLLIGPFGYNLMEVRGQGLDGGEATRGEEGREGHERRRPRYGRHRNGRATERGKRKGSERIGLARAFPPSVAIEVHRQETSRRHVSFSSRREHIRASRCGVEP